MPETKTGSITERVSRRVGKKPRTDAPPPPSADAPGATPAPTPPTPEIPWDQFGRPIKAVLDPVYDTLGAEKIPVEAWAMFAIAWGGVIDHYLAKLAPVMKDTPWPAAVAMTGLVLMPVGLALPEYLDKRRKAAADAREREAAEKASAAA